MTRLWKALATATLGVAAYQWLDLFQFIVGGIASAAEIGRHRLVVIDQPGRLNSFLFWIIGVAAVAAISSRHLRERSPSFARCGRMATYLLLGNAALWVGLVASPLVEHLIPFAASGR